MADRLRPAQYLLLLAGEAAWLYAWSLCLGVWLDGSRAPLLDLPTLAALVGLSALATRLVAGSSRPRVLPRVGLALLGVVAAGLVMLGQVLAMAPPGQWLQAWDLVYRSAAGMRASAGALLALAVWWRGLVVGRARPTLALVEGEFRGGVVMLGLLLAAVALVGPAHAPAAGSLILPILVVVSAGLVGMPLARIVDVSQLSHRRGGTAVRPSGPWLAMLLGVVAALLLVALILAEIVPFSSLETLLAPLGSVLGTLLYYLLLPAGLLVEALIEFLRPRLRMTPPSQGQDNAGDLLKQLREQAQGGQPVAPELLLALKVLLVVTLVAVLVAVLTRAARARGRPADLEEEEVEELRDFVWTWPGLRAVLRWLHSLFGRPRVRAGAPAGEVWRAGAGVARRVGELYREFLALGASIGRARQAAETPLEYEGRLQADPSLSGEAEVRTITDGYVRERYGPPAATAPDLGGLSAALARLRGMWQNRD